MKRSVEQPKEETIKMMNEKGREKQIIKLGLLLLDKFLFI